MSKTFKIIAAVLALVMLAGCTVFSVITWSTVRALAQEREQEEFEDRIERFARIYRMMRDQERQLTAYADLRYENGIALGWKSDDATPQEGGTAVRR